MTTALSKFYNQSKKTVEVQNGGRTAKRTQLIKQHLAKSRKILDVGCNDGSEDVDLIISGKKVSGVDISREAVKKAKKKGVNAYVFDVTSQKPLPFKDNEFDAVIAGEIIEHLIDTDGFILKIKRVLKPNGVLILTTPNLASLGRRLLLLLGKNPFIETSLLRAVGGAPPVGHLRYFTTDTLKELLVSNGFRVLKLTSDNLSFGKISSETLAEIFPGLGWRFIAIARKTATK